VSAWLRAVPFLLVFPGYFAYHWSSLNGWIPLFLGGYVNEVSALVCAGFALAAVLTALTSPRKPVRLFALDWIFCAFMAWFGMVVLLHAAAQTAPGVTKNQLASWFQVLASYLAVRLLPLTQLGRIPLVLAVAFSVLVLFAAQRDLLGLLLASSEDSSAATYQGLARAFLVTAAFGLISVHVPQLRWLAYLVTAFVLFLIGARSEIVGALIMFVVLEIAVSQRPARALVAVAATSILGALALMASMNALIELFPDNRFLLLLLESGSDGSVTERQLYQDMAWMATLDSPLFGAYGHYEKEVSAGAYAHNWVSVWVDLGLVGLVLFVLVHLQGFLAAWSARNAALQFSSPQFRAIGAMALGLLVMVTTFSFLAKHFTDPGLAMVAGLFGALAKTLHINGRRTEYSL
jgi:O-Antigen ligase